MAFNRFGRTHKMNALGYVDETGERRDSLVEGEIIEELRRYQELGFIENLVTAKSERRFYFDSIGMPKRNYWEADAIFDCLVDFQINTDCTNKHVSFEAGVRYVIDVKGAFTLKDKYYRFKKALVQAVHKITITEIVRNKTRSKKPRRAK